MLTDLPNLSNWRDTTLRALTRHNCHWPVGEGTGSAQQFCCQPRLAGVRYPYCEEHYARAVDVVRLRNRRRQINAGTVRSW